MREPVPSLLGAAIACGSALALALPASTQVPETPASEEKLRVEIDPETRVQTNAPPTQDVLVPEPRVSITRDTPVDPALLGQEPAPGQPLQPTLPRAVAPPTGDISVSTIDASPGRIDLNTTARVPRLVLREAPVREVLSLLARSANLNLVFAEGSGGGDDGIPGNTGDAAAAQTISVELENEPVQEVFNAVLLASGLQASRRGSIIYVGASLPQSAQNIVSRTYRLNEVPAGDAASFLATQGAATQQVFAEVIQVINQQTGEIVREIPQPAEIISVNIDDDERGNTPLLLDGLSVSTDERLNALTVVGDLRRVEIATTLLEQLDARRRQVAINVKIVDVNLLNTEDFSASVSFGVGDTFFVSDNGAAALNFGGSNPPTAASATVPGGFTPPIIELPIPGGATGAPFFDFQPDAPFGDVNFSPGTAAPGDFVGGFARPNFGTDANPFQPGITDFTPAVEGTPTLDADGNLVINPLTGGPLFDTQPTPAEIEFTLPELFQTPTDFLATLQAQITSGNAKILTDPTLVVQENETATVNLTSEIFSGVLTTTAPGADEGAFLAASEPNIREAGLILSVAITRIDDNGFISLTVVPSVTAPSGVVPVEDAGGLGEIQLLSNRTLNSGLIRLRDGQTLILSGIIQDSDIVSVSKVPILGDLPILGALFRSTNRVNQRQEVVVLLTPRILDDSLAGGGFGFDADFSPDTRQLLQERNLGIPGNSPERNPSPSGNSQ